MISELQPQTPQVLLCLQCLTPRVTHSNRNVRASRRSGAKLLSRTCSAQALHSFRMGTSSLWGALLVVMVRGRRLLGVLVTMLLRQSRAEHQAWLQLCCYASKWKCTFPFHHSSAPMISVDFCQYWGGHFPECCSDHSGVCSKPPHDACMNPEVLYSPSWKPDGLYARQM